MTQHAPTVGIIGLGFGRAHIPAFQVNGCHVVALWQRDQTSAKAVADRYGVEHVFGRWEDMLETAKPEIVVIATAPHLHRAIAVRAFGAGAHVLCEKPIAMTRTDAEAMVDAARRTGRVAMTCFNWRFTAAMQELHARVTEGSLGRVFHLALRWLGTRGAVSYRVSRERARWWEGELRAGAGAALTPVTPRTPPPTVAADGDPLDVTGRTLIAPLVGHLLEGIRTGTTPSPSLADGMRAQAVLDATLEAAARGAWVEVAR